MSNDGLTMKEALDVSVKNAHSLNQWLYSASVRSGSAPDPEESAGLGIEISDLLDKRYPQDPYMKCITIGMVYTTMLIGLRDAAATEDILDDAVGNANNS